MLAFNSAKNEISDSSSVVAWVNDSDIGNLRHLNFILEIRHWMSSLGNITVIFNSRVSNYLADCLAKRAFDAQTDSLPGVAFFFLLCLLDFSSFQKKEFWSGEVVSVLAAPHLNNIIKYMMLVNKDTDDEVALEACEV
ncbi:hypothetical protein QYF36_023034 [Acer negundo]|nr:hypothetical protein QYF36_023034 [Acer negundo]